MIWISTWIVKESKALYSEAALNDLGFFKKLLVQSN